MAPTIGHIVHYKLSEQDALEINRRRADYRAFEASHRHPHEPGQPPATGHVAHVGNSAAAGEVCPAVVVRIFAPNSPHLVVNLQVLLDGTDAYWATSRKEGDEPGQWAWPARAPEPAAEVSA
jgi:hypothetical protein